MSLVPYIGAWLYIPLETLGKRAAATKGTLTIYPKKFGDEPKKPIRLYDEKQAGYLGVPIDWGLEKFPEIGFEDRTTMGEPCYYNRLPDPHHERAAPRQAEFMADLDKAVADYHTVLAKAATGSGKTVVSLRTAALRGRRTAIVVHLIGLARQWVDEIHKHLGIPYDDIGWVQGDICNYEHPFLVIVTKSLAERRYPAGLYSSVGTIIYDEGHRLGAPLFSGTVGQFAANSKILLTATDKRKDGCAKVFHYYFGQPKVTASQPALAATVHSIDHKSMLPRWAKQPGHIAQLIGEDHGRNDLICRIIGKAYVNGRVFLAIGDRVEHLQELARMCVARGIPPSEIGLYVDQKYTDRTRDSYRNLKVDESFRKVVYWKSDEGEQLYDKYEVLNVEERIGGGYLRVTSSEPPFLGNVVHMRECRHLPDRVAVTVRVEKEELDEIEIRCSVIFATYGKMKEGIDIPRLDAGMDVTPRSDGEQVIGRIRRPVPGKPEPLWWTIRDVGHEPCERYWNSRCKDYRGSNCKVINHGFL